MPSVARRLVLIGGGHAQVEVLRRWAQHPVPNAELILITAELRTPYSGMIPGVIAGHYRPEDALLDLVPLAAAARAVLLHDQVTGIDLARRCVHRQRGGPVPFDVMSLNVGSTPASGGVPGARELALPVKPIRHLLAGITRLEAQRPAAAKTFRVAMVGSGAAGVEVLLALRHRWRKQAGIQWQLFGAEAEPLAAFPAGVRRRFRRVFEQQSIQFTGGTRVAAVEPGRLRTTDGHEFGFDALFWAAGAAAPEWLADTGLARDPAGFVAINAFLQSPTDPAIFAAGDCATQIDTPSPKAGVFAVRQGPVLYHNLCRALRQEPLQPFVPQSRFLSLLATGDRHAVGCRGGLSLAGGWVWSWKDYIDRHWLARYRAGTPAQHRRRPPTVPSP